MNETTEHFDRLNELLSENIPNEVIIAVDEFVIGVSNYGRDLQKLTEPQKIFLFNQMLEKEINNGGFHQFFLNSSGEYAHEILESLKVIKAFKTADVVNSAIRGFPGECVPKDRDERVKAVNEINQTTYDKWEELDQQFYSYQEDLNSLNLDFIRRNKESF